MRLAIQAARRLYATRAAAWTVAGLAVMMALAAILLPGGRGTVVPYAASFDGLLQVGALFRGAWQSEPHICTASVVNSPSGDVIATAAHCLSGNAKDLEFVPMYHDGQAPYGEWNVTGAYVSQQWLTHQDPQADFAFLTVGPRDIGGTERTTESVVGGDPLITGTQPPQWTVVTGYPGAGGASPSSASTRPSPGMVTHPSAAAATWTARAADPGWPTTAPRRAGATFTA